MMEIKNVSYELVVLTPNGDRVPLQPAISKLDWEEQPEELSVRLTAELENIEYGSGRLHQILPLNGKVFLYANWGVGQHEIFRGTIFRNEVREDPQEVVTITAYDTLIYLARSQDDRYYPAGTKGRTIIEDIAKAWQIPLGTIEGPNASLAAQPFRSQKISQMFETVLKESKKRGDGKYIIRSVQDRINVVRPGQNSPIYHFTSDITQSVTDIQDIEALITRVKIVGAEAENERRPVVATLDGRTEFGILQELVYEDQFDTPEAARQGAQDILDERGKPTKERRFEAPDVPFLRRGDKIHVQTGTLNGYYLIKGISHNATKQTMLVEVEDP